jgi:hypothetical protein
MFVCFFQHHKNTTFGAFAMGWPLVYPVLHFQDRTDPGRAIRKERKKERNKQTKGFVN